jgi:hypothetical protein
VSDKCRVATLVNNRNSPRCCMRSRETCGEEAPQTTPRRRHGPPS